MADIKTWARPDEVLDVHLEALINEPRSVLASLCAFLGLEAQSDYLDQASSSVNSKPNPSREKVDWPAELRASIDEGIAAHPFLSGYRFEDVEWKPESWPSAAIRC